jgi:hypothetical protein
MTQQLTNQDPVAMIGNQHHPAVKPMIEELQRLRGSKVITYFLAEGAAIGEDVVYWLYEQLLRLGKQPQIDLFLVSRGGATDVPWRIVTLIREFTDRFCVLVPFHAQSAATHICLGADEIVMTELGQLGPVDPSRTHPLLPEDKFQPPGQDPRPLSISVQDLRQFLQFIANEDAEAEGRMKVTDPTPIYVELMHHVHPLVIGAMEQTYSLAKQLTVNMLRLHMDPGDESIEQLADKFADYYKAHSYPIGRKEAIDLGLKVTVAPDDLRDVMWQLWKRYTMVNVHMEAQQLPLGTITPSTAKVAFDSASYVDSESASAVGFRKTDPSGKVLGGQWWGWFPQPS